MDFASLDDFEPLAQTNEDVRLCSCGQQPAGFGPPTWKFLHVWALGFPNDPTDEQRNAYLATFYALQKTLGCVSCSRHMLEHLIKQPPNLANRTTLTIWLWEFHNAVNARTHKCIFTWEQFRVAYLGDAKLGCAAATIPFSSSSSSSNWIWAAVGGFVLGLVLILLLRWLMGRCGGEKKKKNK